MSGLSSLPWEWSTCSHQNCRGSGHVRFMWWPTTCKYRLHRAGWPWFGWFKDYDICLRTDKHSQSIYGPSVTPLESPGRDGTHQVTLVALGGSKAMHEFLVSHYLATDSAREWDVFLDSCLPQCTWVRAGSRRALALHMYDNCHIASSHRRFAHPSWLREWRRCLTCCSVPANIGTWEKAWLIHDLLKSMWGASRLALTAAFAYCIFCGTCLMSK